jgi:hypothetical protein
MLIARPNGLTFDRWAAEVSLQLEAIGLASNRPDENRWQEWAVSAISIPQLSQFNPPNPYQFNHWQDWAERFILGVE